MISFVFSSWIINDFLIKDQFKAIDELIYERLLPWYEDNDTVLVSFVFCWWIINELIWEVFSQYKHARDLYLYIQYHLSSFRHSKCKPRFHFQQKIFDKLHKLSRSQNSRDQLSVHSVHWLRGDESCPNRAKIHRTNFQILFCSQSSFCKSPQSHLHVFGT